MTPQEMAEALVETYGVAVEVKEDGSLVVDKFFTVSLEGSDEYDDDKILFTRLTLESLLQTEYLEEE